MAGSWGRSSSRSRVAWPPISRASAAAASASSSASGSLSSVIDATPPRSSARYSRGQRVDEVPGDREALRQRPQLDALVGAMGVAAVRQAQAERRDAAAQRGVGVGGRGLLLGRAEAGGGARRAGRLDQRVIGRGGAGGAAGDRLPPAGDAGGRPAAQRPPHP